MSRIYFHSQHGEAEVRGSERAYLGGLANDLALAVLDPHFDRREQLTPLLPADSYLHAMQNRDDRQWWENFKTWFSVGFRGGLTVDGTEYEPFGIALNTLVAMGNEVLRFCARVHGYCEIHGWVEDADREWLADVIDAGRRENVLRPAQGWESVAEFLRTTTGPVVMSYSVCESFPNAGIADWTPDPAAVVIPEGYADEGFDEEAFRRDAAWDAWYDLSSDEQWALGMRGVRSREYDLRLTPNDDRGFGPGLSAFDIANRPVAVES